MCVHRCLRMGLSLFPNEGRWLDGSVTPSLLGGDHLPPCQLAKYLHPLSPAWVGPGQPQFRQVLRTQGLALSNTKNVPFLSVAGGYFGTFKEDQATTSEGQRWKVRLLSVLFCFCFGHATVVCRILVPLLGLNSSPLQWKGGVPNTSHHGKSPSLCV